jgi:hypothetical protein
VVAVDRRFAAKQLPMGACLRAISARPMLTAAVSKLARQAGGVELFPRFEFRPTAARARRHDVTPDRQAIVGQCRARACTSQRGSAATAS